MHVETVAVGPLACNCSILADLDHARAFVIDPGSPFDVIARRLDALGVTIEAVLHTHAHLDHVGATAEVVRRFRTRALLHEADRFLYDLLPIQSALIGIEAPEPVTSLDPLADGQHLATGGLEVEVIHTPGHSPGGVCLLVRQGDRPWLFAGDTLFRRGVGRTDLWGGDEAQLVRSIRDRLLVLPDATVVVPGHGPSTTIGEERLHNPFLRAG